MNPLDALAPLAMAVALAALGATWIANRRASNAGEPRQRTEKPGTQILDWNLVDDRPEHGERVQTRDDEDPPKEKAAGASD